jgi:hypothetical protein
MLTCVLKAHVKDLNVEILIFFLLSPYISLIWFGGQFWHQVVPTPLDRSYRGSNRGPPYQIQRQSPLKQLTIEPKTILMKQ